MPTQALSGNLNAMLSKDYACLSVARVGICASLTAVYVVGTDTFQIQSMLNLAYRMMLKKQWD
jgi:hypothetical protein